MSFDPSLTTHDPVARLDELSASLRRLLLVHKSIAQAIDRGGGDPSLAAGERKLVGEVAALGGLLERFRWRRGVARSQEIRRDRASATRR